MSINCKINKKYVSMNYEMKFMNVMSKNKFSFKSCNNSLFSACILGWIGQSKIFQNQPNVIWMGKYLRISIYEG